MERTLTNFEGKLSKTKGQVDFESTRYLTVKSPVTSLLTIGGTLLQAKTEIDKLDLKDYSQFNMLKAVISSLQFLSQDICHFSLVGNEATSISNVYDKKNNRLDYKALREENKVITVKFLGDPSLRLKLECMFGS